MKFILLLVILGATIACSTAWPEPEPEPFPADPAVVQKDITKAAVDKGREGRSFLQVSEGYPMYGAGYARYGGLYGYPYYTRGLGQRYVIEEPLTRAYYNPGYYSTYTINQ